MTELLSNFGAVASQVFVLFLLIAVGFICGKTKLIDDNISKGLSDLVLYFATPAVIINSFFRPFEQSMLIKFIIAFGISVVFHVVAGILAFAFIRNKNIDSRLVGQFGVVFSNAGYMALPLQAAILGDVGVFFGSAYVVVFNVILWTYGLVFMGGKDTKITVKKLIFNPGVMAITIGLIMFLTNSSHIIPDPIKSAVGHIGNLNTPVPMIIIGYYLSKSKIITAITDSRIWLPISTRLVISPIISLVLLMLLQMSPLRIENTIAVSCIIAVSAPCAAVTTVFSAKYNRDTALSVKLVSVSTLLSIITMPLFVALAQLIL
ncbi:MAG: AEC family transporter [Acutalibacteraceae bacterium]|nr:AEC family transporter [Acutalibacteraceae bacterium]